MELAVFIFLIIAAALVLGSFSHSSQTPPKKSKILSDLSCLGVDSSSIKKHNDLIQETLTAGISNELSREDCIDLIQKIELRKQTISQNPNDEIWDVPDI
jgi:hypothetical protein